MTQVELGQDFPSYFQELLLIRFYPKFFKTPDYTYTTIYWNFQAKGYSAGQEQNSTVSGDNLACLFSSLRVILLESLLILFCHAAFKTKILSSWHHLAVLHSCTITMVNFLPSGQSRQPVSVSRASTRSSVFYLDLNCSHKSWGAGIFFFGLGVVCSGWILLLPLLYIPRMLTGWGWVVLPWRGLTRREEPPHFCWDAPWVQNFLSTASLYACLCSCAWRPPWSQKG